MTYIEFRNSIRSALRKNPHGLTWRELKLSLDLPYDRPCPEWTRQLEKEIGLVRRKGAGRTLVWHVRKVERAFPKEWKTLEVALPAFVTLNLSIS